MTKNGEENNVYLFTAIYIDSLKRYMAGVAAFRDRKYKTLRPFYPRLDTCDNAKEGKNVNEGEAANKIEAANEEEIASKKRGREDESVDEEEVGDRKKERRDE